MGPKGYEEKGGREKGRGGGDCRLPGMSHLIYGLWIIVRRCKLHEQLLLLCLLVCLLVELLQLQSTDRALQAKPSQSIQTVKSLPKILPRE